MTAKPWSRLFFEAIIIAGSVYLAIVMEGMSQQQEEREDAIQALIQLREELKQDRQDLQEIITEQKMLAQTYSRVVVALGDISSLSVDQFDADLFILHDSNRTMFPRKATWTTMLAGGQLRVLNDQPLITSLGNLYENKTERLEYNGAIYDDEKARMAYINATEVWDSHNKRFFSTDPAVIKKARALIAWTQGSNTFYLNLVIQWGEALDEAIAKVNEHLAPVGY